MNPFTRPRSVPDEAPSDPAATALRNAGRGDETAFAMFYDLTASLVYGIVSKIVRDPAMSEEVTQEVFVELWQLAPRFDHQKGSPKGLSLIHI